MGWHLSAAIMAGAAPGGTLPSGILFPLCRSSTCPCHLSSSSSPRHSWKQQHTQLSQVVAGPCARRASPPRVWGCQSCCGGWQQVVQQSSVGGLGRSGSITVLLPAMVSKGRYFLVPACQFWSKVNQSWAPCWSPTGAEWPYGPSLGTGEEHGREGALSSHGLPLPSVRGSTDPPPLQQWRMQPWPRHRASSPPRQQPNRCSSCSRASTTMSSRSRTSPGPALHPAGRTGSTAPASSCLIVPGLRRTHLSCGSTDTTRDTLPLSPVPWEFCTSPQRLLGSHGGSPCVDDLSACCT